MSRLVHQGLGVWASEALDDDLLNNNANIDKNRKSKKSVSLKHTQSPSSRYPGIKSSTKNAPSKTGGLLQKFEPITPSTAAGTPFAGRTLQKKSSSNNNRFRSGVDSLERFFTRGLDFSASGVPAVLKGAGRRQLEDASFQLPTLDWTTPGVPKAFQRATKVDFSPQTLLKGFSWNQRGVPWEEEVGFSTPTGQKQKLREEFWAEPSSFVDWNAKGIPQVFERARWSKGVDVVKRPMKIDWSGKGIPEIFKKLTPPSATNSRSGKNSEELVLNWNQSGLPKQLTRVKFWQKELLLDWAQTGLPVIPTKRSQEFFVKGGTFAKSLDWSAEGIPEFIAKAQFRALFNREGLVLDWSRRGLARCFQTAGLEFTSTSAHAHYVVPGNLRLEGKSQNELKKDRLKLAKKKAHFEFVMKNFSRNKKRVQEESARYDGFRRQLLPKAKKLSKGFKKNKRLGEYKGKNLQWRARDAQPQCDWSEKGVPSLIRENLQFFKGQEITLDWSAKGISHEFSIGSKRKNVAVSADKSEISTPLKVQTLAEEDDWVSIGTPSKASSRSGFSLKPSVKKIIALPAHNNLDPLSSELSIDWSQSSPPLGKRFVNDQFKIDWSATGLPDQLETAPWGTRFGSRFVSTPKNNREIKLNMSLDNFQVNDVGRSPKFGGYVKAQDENLWLSMGALQRSKEKAGEKKEDTTSKLTKKQLAELNRVRSMNDLPPILGKTKQQNNSSISSGMGSWNEINTSTMTSSTSKAITKSRGQVGSSGSFDFLNANESSSRTPSSGSDDVMRKGKKASASTVTRPFIGPLLPPGWKTSKDSTLSKKGNGPGTYTAAEKKAIWFAKQLDWAADGVAGAFRKTEERRKAKQVFQKFLAQKYERCEDVPSYVLNCDWALCAKRKLPSVFRGLETWSVQRGRKQFFDELILDWSKSGLPKELWDANPLCRDFQFNPLIVDWSEVKIPQTVRLVAESEKWLANPSFDWSARGVPTTFSDLEVKPAARRGFWDVTGIHVQWADKGLPLVTVSPHSKRAIAMWKLNTVEAFEEPTGVDFSQKGVPEEFRASLFDCLSIDWTQEGCLDPCSVQQKGVQMRRRTKMNGKNVEENERLMRVSMAVSFVVEDGVNTFNKRKNRAFGGENRQEKSLGFEWKEGELKPKLKPVASAQTQKDGNNASLQANPSKVLCFARSYMIGSQKRNLSVQKPEICWMNWAKPGIDLWKTVRKDRTYGLDWASSGIPSVIERADFSPKGVNYDNNCDWSTAGAPPMPRFHNCKGANGTYNQRGRDMYWILQDALPGSVQRMEDTKSTRGVFYQSVDWSRKGLPGVVNDSKLEEPAVGKDWSAPGLPLALKDLKYEGGFPVDWSQRGIPNAANLTKRDNGEWRNIQEINWNEKGLPKLFKAVVEKGDNNFEKARNSDLFESVDWSVENPFLPVKDSVVDKWEYFSLDWSNKGLPRGGLPSEVPYKEFLLDWSATGIPEVIHAADFFTFEMQLAAKFPEIVPRKRLFGSRSQDKWIATLIDDYSQIRYLETYRPDFKAMNKLKERLVTSEAVAIRGYKWEYRMGKNKRTKRALGLALRARERKAAQLQRKTQEKGKSQRKKMRVFDRDVENGKIENWNDVAFGKEYTTSGVLPKLMKTLVTKTERGTQTFGSGSYEEWLASQDVRRSIEQLHTPDKPHKARRMPPQLPEFVLQRTGLASSEQFSLSNHSLWSAHELPANVQSQIPESVHCLSLKKPRAGDKVRAKGFHSELWRVAKDPQSQKSHKSLVMQKTGAAVRKLSKGGEEAVRVEIAPKVSEKKALLETNNMPVISEVAYSGFVADKFEPAPMKKEGFAMGKEYAPLSNDAQSSSLFISRENSRGPKKLGSPRRRDFRGSLKAEPKGNTKYAHPL